ncbi:hypothetical protein GMDG_02851 [Pseudogymnoascus destructans 20631-21]|uniref:Uncharacterized protein n=1 Tax=Pseudogymnoascus destructans (strain ATCC MYA-4855 / 20631-21) TaxID=658429 RepID=L8G5R0_PSED2|nr:hypothetical protein GMDG_02851 [Pseudogymnoascus destructans 20631-21]
MSAPQPSGILSSTTSSFGQFRLTTFVDAHPKPASTTAAGVVANAPDNIAAASLPPQSSTMAADGPSSDAPAQLLRPHSNPSASPLAPTTSSTSTTTLPAPSPARRAPGFGVLDLTAPSTERSGKLGAHRDGRVRNPVPRKLKGKTDQRNGNFAVMHMDMSSSSGGGRMVPRGEAAQRASENTAKAARSMLQDSYRVKRRRVDGGEPAVVVQQPYVVPSEPLVAQQPVHRTQPMSAEETKYEQARLLTLLRSISPLAVVDQMCKALAFFGGIPGAPVPEDEAFPASDDANGSGALFVGWLSEIFPEPERKGSKASKVRKDKGIKKGPKDGGREGEGGAVSVLDEDEDADADGADEEWVDIGESESILHDKGSGQTGTNASGAFVPVNSSGTGIIELEPEELNEPELLDPPATANIGKRRPGRPRGSRNRPKEKDAEGNEVPAVEVFSLNQSSAPSTSSPVMTMQSANSQTPTSQPKRKAGRPPGSKTKPKETPILPTISVSPTLSRSNRAAVSQTATPTNNIAAVPQGLSAEELAVVDAYRKSKTSETAVPTPTTKPAEKRKHGPRKSSNGFTAEDAVTVTAAPILPPSTITPPVAPQQSEPSRANSQQVTPKSASAGPAAKRQRKSKDLTTAASKTNVAQDTAILKSTPTPTPASAPVARAIPVTSSQQPVCVPSTTMFSSSLPMASEQIMAPARAPAQGLQAHYDRFTSIQQQQQAQQHQQHQQQQHQQQQQRLDPRHDPHLLTRTSPLQTPFYQPHHPQSQPQARHIPTPSPSHFTHYQPQQPARTYHTSANAEMDPYRAAAAAGQQQQQQHATFSPRQQNPQQQQQFAHYTEASFIDLPALEEGGAGEGGGYGGAGGTGGMGQGSGGFGDGRMGRVRGLGEGGWGSGKGDEGAG